MIGNTHSSPFKTHRKKRKKTANDSLDDFSRLTRAHFLVFQSIFQVFCVIKSNYGSTFWASFEYIFGIFQWSKLALSVDNVYTTKIPISLCSSFSSSKLCIYPLEIYIGVCCFSLAFAIMFTFPSNHSWNACIFAEQTTSIQMMAVGREQMCCKNLLFRIRNSMKLNESRWKWWLKSSNFNTSRRKMNDSGKMSTQNEKKKMQLKKMRVTLAPRTFTFRSHKNSILNE